MNKDNIIQQLFWAFESRMEMCFNQFSSRAGVSLNTSNQDCGENKWSVRHQIELFNVLNDEFVAGPIGLEPAYLPRSHSLQYAHAWSAVAVLSVDAFFQFFCKLIFPKVLVV